MSRTCKLFKLWTCRFDVYRKVPKDLTEPTLTGAVSKFLNKVVVIKLCCDKFYNFHLFGLSLVFVTCSCEPLYIVLSFSTPPNTYTSSESTDNLTEYLFLNLYHSNYKKCTASKGEFFFGVFYFQKWVSEQLRIWLTYL